MEKDIAYDEYKKVVPLYKRAEKNVKEAIKEFLNEKNISLVTIESRIKEFDSFFQKISRKNYDNPFEDNEDFCGLRIILYYQDDIEKVEDIIKENFSIQESINKTKKLGNNEFGYRSNHLIIKIKDEWCVTPNYKGLKDIKIEVQVRTGLMHTWAAIEHKLGYKNDQELPKDLRRKLYLLSGLLENADIQFQEIKNEAEKFQIKTVEKSKKEGRFIGEKLNIDTVQALLEYYFPDYSDNKALTEEILDILIKNNIDIKEAVECAEQILPHIEKIDNLVLSDEITSKANLMLYALEAFSSKVKSFGEQRQKLLDKVIKKKK